MEICLRRLDAEDAADAAAAAGGAGGRGSYSSSTTEDNDDFGGGSTFGDGPVNLGDTAGTAFSYGSDTDNWLPPRAYEPGEPGMWDGHGSGSLKIHEGPNTGGLDWEGVRNSLDTQDYPRQVPRSKPTASKVIQVGSARVGAAKAMVGNGRNKEELELAAFMASAQGRASYRDKAAELTGCLQGNLALIGFSATQEHARFGFSDWAHVRAGEPFHMGIIALYMMRLFSRPVYDYLSDPRFSNKVKNALTSPAVEAVDFLIAAVEVMIEENTSTVVNVFAKAMGPAMNSIEFWSCTDPFPVHSRLSILFEFVKWGIAKHNKLVCH
jgi:hypothetical protein